MMPDDINPLAKVLAEMLCRGSGLPRLFLPDVLRASSALVQYANHLSSPETTAFYVSKFEKDGG